MEGLLSDGQRSEITIRTRTIVETLATQFPSRSGLNPTVLSGAAQYLEDRFKSLDLHVNSQWYDCGRARVRNLIVEQQGRDSRKAVIVLGAHYDTVVGTPGADDNASGVAGLFELARILKKYKNQRTIQFVVFTHEEPPYFYTSHMGSRKCANKMRREGQKVHMMFSLEMLGFGGIGLRQAYPFPLMRKLGGYPNDGNFIAIVGNLRSMKFVKPVRESMRSVSSVGVESLTAPGFLPPLFLSDHSSFWKEGYSALMVTDTAFLRNPHYHLPSDTFDTLNYEFLSEVVCGVFNAVVTLDQG